MQFKDGRAAQLTSSALVGFGGIGEAVAEHDFAGGDGRLNDFMNVLRAGSEHEREFGVRVEAGGARVE